MSKNIYSLYKNVIEDKYPDYTTPPQKKRVLFDPTLIQIGHLVHFSATTISYHDHDHWEFAFAANGKFNAVIDGKKHLVQKGDLVIYSPGTKHMEEPRGETEAEIYFLAVDNVFFQNNGNKYIIDATVHPVVNTGNLYSQLNMQLMELLIEINNHNFLRTEYIENLAKLILINIIRVLKNEQNDILVNDKIKEIADFIDKHFREDFDLDSLADSASYSKFYFSRLFKEHTGVSPMKYLQQKRLEESKKLLETTGLSVAEIAQNVGISAVGYYCQLFKKAYRMTPSEYRDSLKAKN